MKNTKLPMILVMTGMLMINCAILSVSQKTSPVPATETQGAAANTPTIPPQPTRTPRPTYTATPVPDWIVNFAEPILKAIVGRAPDYQDDFSNPRSGWYNGTTSDHPDVKIDGEKRYEDGEYSITANGVTSEEPVVCSGVEDRNVGAYADFVAEFDVRYVSGFEGDWHLQFHRNSKGLYKVGATSSGEINIGKCEDGQDGCPALVSFVGAPIKSGTEWNHIQLIVQGLRMAVYANGAPVLYVEDSLAPEEFKKGYFSLNLCNFGPTAIKTRWDNFKVWDISTLP